MSSTEQPLEEIDVLRARVAELERKELSNRPEEAVEGRRLAVLSRDVSLALIQSHSVQESLQLCTQALVTHLEAAFARIWTLNSAEQVLELQASSGLYTHLDGPHSRVPVGMFKIGLIAAERLPHLTNSVIGDPRVSNQEWARHEGMVAFAGYPLLVGEQLIGVIALFARHELGDAALEAMATIANNIALGIERMRMQSERAEILISEQRARAEAEVARQRLHDLFQQAPAIICVLRGPEHIYELANPRYLQIVGKQDILGKPIREALPELAGQGFYELLDHIYTTGEPFIGSEMKAQLDQQHTGVLEDVYLNFIYQPSRNSSGEIDGILLYATDVTEQVNAREAVKQSQERLKLAQRAGRIGTFERYIKRNHTFWTAELEELYGLPTGSFEGKHESWEQRVHPEDLARAQESLQGAIAGGPPYNVEFRIIWPDGSIHWVLGKGEMFFDEQGQPDRIVGVNIDISELKEAERQLHILYQNVQDLNANLEVTVSERTEVLRQLNAELQLSNQELQDFAYVASHDLQEPLRKIQAFGNLLEEEHGDALGDGKAYLDRMRNAATRMRVLIEDLLTFSRVASRALPFSPVNLAAVALQVVDDLESRLQTTQGKIEVGSLPVIEADPLQMYQLFQNLLNNAVKFHQRDIPPVVTVTASIQTSSPEGSPSQVNEQCLLCIQDNGIGFDEKYVDRIFTMFQRLHGKGDYEGTGIGLAVVRKIVDRHGGTITVKSAPGKGTTFLVMLPVHQILKEAALHDQ